MQELTAWTDWIDVRQLTAMLIGYVPKIVAALLILVGFAIVVRVTRPALRKVLRRSDFSEALVQLLVDNVYRYLLFAIGAMMAASQLGINVAAALGTLGIAGVAVGFAAQDSLANSIAGFMIFWDKPFRVGDYITAGDEDLYGRVTAITLRTTRIRTPDNTYVIIPNKEIIDEALVNHSMYGEMRVNVAVGIAYKEDVGRARAVLLEAVGKLDAVRDDPAPEVVLEELGASSVNLLVRVWVDNANQERSTFFQVLEVSKAALDEAGIEIPFPHLQLFVDEVDEGVWEEAARIPERLRVGDDESVGGDASSR